MCVLQYHPCSLGKRLQRSNLAVEIEEVINMSKL